MPNDDDVNLLQQLIHYGGTQAFSLVPLALRKVITEKQWQRHVDGEGKPFTSFKAFVEHDLWQGLETTIDDLELHCRKDPGAWKEVASELEPAGKHGINQHTGGGHDNIRSSKSAEYGTSKLYTLKRLKRDHPAVFQQVIGGALSVNEGAIEAGFRKRTSNRTVQLAAALLALGDIPYEDAKQMTAAQIISLYQFDHFPIRKADGGPDEAWNLKPRLIAAHRHKTSTVDQPQLAKSKRIRAKQQRHLERMVK